MENRNILNTTKFIVGTKDYNWFVSHRAEDGNLYMTNEPQADPHNLGIFNSFEEALNELNTVKHQLYRFVCESRIVPTSMCKSKTARKELEDLQESELVVFEYHTKINLSQISGDNLQTRIDKLSAEKLQAKLQIIDQIREKVSAQLSIGKLQFILESLGI